MSLMRFHVSGKLEAKNVDMNLDVAFLTVYKKSRWSLKSSFRVGSIDSNIGLIFRTLKCMIEGLG